MKIKIKENASSIYAGSTNDFEYSHEWYNIYKELAGEIIEVETDYLFSNQFNTVPIEGISDIGLRIMEEYVEEVIDDEREGKGRCQYCGENVELADNYDVDELICINCGKEGYIEKFDI